jgi:predicted metal-dependent hydrolase
MAPPELSEGISLFNSRRYFEAHEIWEDLWRKSDGPPRLFYQGLIHAAVGLHHFSCGNRQGARAQLAKSLEKLDGYAADYGGMDVSRLREELRRILDRIDVLKTASVTIVRF